MANCKKCGGKCHPSKALNNTMVYYDDFGGDAGGRGTTGSRSGKPKMVECLKCEDCGHSFVPEKEQKKGTQRSPFGIGS